MYSTQAMEETKATAQKAEAVGVSRAFLVYHNEKLAKLTQSTGELFNAK